MTVPSWGLSLAYWLHMLATVVWIGSLATLALVVLPAAHKALNAQSYADLIGQIQRRLDPLAWFSLVLLAGTGMLQMSANPNYQGFLAIENRWAVVIFVKHILFILMAGISAFMTWGVLPELRRQALRQARGLEADRSQSQVLLQREVWLLRVNLILGVLVLALTAVARST